MYQPTPGVRRRLRNLLRLLASGRRAPDLRLLPRERCQPREKRVI